jgi:O-antigen/teichoic acid export membrane protein
MNPNSSESTHVLSLPDAGLGGILRTAGITGISTLVAQSAGYLTVFALTLSLGVRGFGLFSLATTLMSVTTLVAALGLDVAVVRFVAWYRGRGDTRKLQTLLLFATVLVLIWSVIVAIGLWELAPFLSWTVFKEPALVPSVRIVCIGIPLNALFLVFVSGLHGLGLTTRRVYAEQIILPLSRLVFVVVAMVAKASVEGALLAMVAASGVSLAVAGVWLARKSWFWKSSLAPLSDWKALTKYTLPAFLDALLVTQQGGSLEILLLGMFGTKEMVGIYSVVLRFRLIISLPMAAFNTTLAPLISEAHARSDRERLKGLFNSATRWVMILSLPLVAIIVLFGGLLLGLFGQAYTAGYLTLTLMALGQLVNVCVGPVGHMLLMTGYSRIRLLNSLVLLATQLGLGLLFIPAWQLEGAGVVAAVSVVVVSLLGLIEVFVLLKIHPYQLELTKPLLACCLAGAAIAIAQALLGKTLIPQILLLSGLIVAYVGVLVGLGLNPNDKQLVLQTKNRLVAKRL